MKPGKLSFGNFLTRPGKPILLLLLPIFFFLFLPGPTYAQRIGNEELIEWRELETEHFIIVYAETVPGFDNTDCACGVGEAEIYAAFIDDVYKDLVTIFSVELETPINLRLFPTEESYYEVNPVARQLTGVIAHALNNREEIAIAVTRTRHLNEAEIANNLRHELTHFFASLLSDGKLNTGFQEGVAQYIERPTENSGSDPALLQQAFDEHRLLTWAELDSAEKVFRDPQVAYPQSLSIVSFLIDRYGFAKFIEFIKANATEPGYRSALGVTYGKSTEQLEAEWASYLPEYFEGRWQINAVYAYDLSRITRLVDSGAFTAAETELVEVIELLKTTDQAETLTQAELLLNRIHQGQTAGALADEARQSFLADDYAQAIAKSREAISMYEQLNYRQRIPELQVYIQRAEIGQDALARLERGEQLLGTLRFIEAEKEIYDATTLLQSLGNQTAQERGVKLLNESAFRQSLIAYIVLGLGVLLLVFNGLRRLAYRFTANPLEIEFT